ncbi:AAA family ATPase [Ceratobasidium sp. AG-Ba]|nr:AAA family ATPase [Ceratobasidium sp. AG-Ba]
MPRPVRQSYRGPSYPGGTMWTSDGEGQNEENIDVNAYYLCVDQVWDPNTMGCWRTSKFKPLAQPANSGKLIFKACCRSYGGSGQSTDDHTWIELRSPSLVELLRSEDSLKGIDGLLQTQPGVDARHLFLRLARLRALAIQPPAPVPVQHASSEAVEPKVTEASRGDQIESEVEAESVGYSEPVPTGEVPPVNAPTPMEPPLSAPQQLWILVDFVEEHFRETSQELERLTIDGYVSFRLLWMLCTPGSIIEIRDSATNYPAGLGVQTWAFGQNSFNVEGVKFVWNGNAFMQTHVSVPVKYFKGLVKTDILPIKKLSNRVRTMLIDRGKLYQKFAGLYHLSYDAFGIVKTRKGHSRRPAKGRVMLDTAGFHRYSGCTPRPTNAMGMYESPPSTPRQPTTSLDHDCLKVGEYQSSDSLPDDVLCVFPPAHHGWSFTAKRWTLLLVEHLSEIVFDEMAFDQLVLKQDYKTMIKALVETHAGRGDGFIKDLVQGKGGGMVMVLHGKPGTGKTLTAEAISEHLKCPLYIVSSGELGIQADQLERQLSDILEMAATWNAVVLIDEADVFLEARNTHDLQRNSLVSVFLRLLEYHTGVLILTTNRIQTFDTAFVSRFSIALNYPDLDQTSRLLIWKEFLSRASVRIGEIEDNAPSQPLFIAYKDLVTLSEKPFNGRVIKQLVRGAQALALAASVPLELSHIMTVLRVTEQFEVDWKGLGLVAPTKGSVLG